MRVRTSALLLCCLLPMLANGQFREQAEVRSLEGIVLNPGMGINSVAPLLDPARMTWSHSVEMGYASSGSASLGSGLYMSQLDYQLSRTMEMSLQLGVHSLFHNSVLPGATGEQFVGGAEFRWRPSENMLLSVAASRGVASSHGYRGSAWSMWSRDPWRY